MPHQSAAQPPSASPAVGKFTIDAQGNVVIPADDTSRAMLEIPEVPTEFNGC